MPTENFSLADHQAEFIRRSVGCGRYTNASEVVRAGLRLLEQQEAENELRLENLRRLVKSGFDQIDRGEYTAYTPETFDAFMATIDRDLRTERGVR